MNLPQLQLLIILIYAAVNQLISAAVIPKKYETEIFKRNVNKDPVTNCYHKSNSDEAYNILAKIINDFEEDNFGDQVTKKICKHIELWNRLGEIVKKVQNNCNTARKYDTQTKDDHKEEEEGYDEDYNKKPQRNYSNSEESEEEARFDDSSAEEYSYGKKSTAVKEKGKNSKGIVPIRRKSEEERIYIKDRSLIRQSQEDHDDIRPNKHKSKVHKEENSSQKKPKTDSDAEHEPYGLSKNSEPKSRKPEGEKPSKTKKPEDETADKDRASTEQDDRLDSKFLHNESKTPIRKHEEEFSGKKKHNRNKKTHVQQFEDEYGHKTSDKDDASDALALIVDKNNFQTVCNRKRYPIYADSEACKAFHAQQSQ